MYGKSRKGYVRDRHSVRVYDEPKAWKIRLFD